MTQGYSYKHQPRPVSQLRTRQRRPRSRTWLLGLLILFGLTGLPLQGEPTSPKAVLVLGGSPDRERFAARFAQAHPGLPIWVSGGSNPEYAEMVFADASIDRSRVHLDYQAVDTVTNFTTVVGTLREQGIDSLYLITSDYHMPRARLIGHIILGSQGIHFAPITIQSEQGPESPESLEKILRDGARSILWILTGSTGSHLGKFLPAQPLQFWVEPLSRP